MNKHIHTLPDGTKATRSSKGRVYTHVIIGRKNLVRERAAAEAMRAQHINNFAFYQQYASTPVGESWNGKSWCIIKPIDAPKQAQYAAIVAEHGTAENYADAMVRQSLERIGSDDAGTWSVLQWSMSAANAAKGMNKFRDWFVDVQVQPVAA